MPNPELRGRWDQYTHFITKDSGEREKYDSGMVRDTSAGKDRFDLMFPEDVPYAAQLFVRVAKLLARGAKKYGDRNWEKANSPAELARFKQSAFRHFMQWYLGADPEEDHAAAVFFNVMAVERLERKAVVE